MGSGVHRLSSLIRHWTHIPCIARQILNHWTTREILSILDMYFLKVIPVSSEERCVQCLNVSQIILKTTPPPFFFLFFFWKMEPKVYRPLSLLCFPPVYIFLFKFGNCWSRIRNQTRSSSKRNRCHNFWMWLETGKWALKMVSKLGTKSRLCRSLLFGSS